LKVDPAEFRCNWLSKDQIWARADEVRARFWSENSLPVNVEEIIEFRLELVIYPQYGLLSQIDVDAYLREDLSGIVVDHDCYMNEKFANRLRFSYAHELGHYFQHDYIYKNMNFESSEQWKRFVLQIPDDQYGNFEYQANEFAGRLLVPRGELIGQIEKATEYLRKNNLTRYLEDNPDAVLSSISPLISRQFGVSSGVIERRIDRERLWPPNM